MKMKKLEGINLTPEILRIAESALTLDIPKKDDDNVTATNNKKLQSAQAMACATYSPSKAYHIIEGFLNEVKQQQKNNNEYNPTKDVVPIQVIKSIHTILKIQSSTSTNGADITTLNNEIQKSYLTYTMPQPPTQSELKAKEEYKKRLEKLKLYEEERKYGSITNNIQLKVDEESNIKSMSYATSIGLNMIVAPISFGVFMYFFSHQLFTWGLSDDAMEDLNNKKVDVKRVITAVISGVIMLFIEMILFVIRSHEMEEAIRKKKKVNANPSPFQPMK